MENATKMNMGCTEEIFLLDLAIKIKNSRVKIIIF